MNLEIEISRELKRRILQVIKKSYYGQGHLLDEGDAIILFHWVRFQDDPVYDFVPKKYRTTEGGKKNELPSRSSSRTKKRNRAN
jgi:hypothetical protein